MIFTCLERKRERKTSKFLDAGGYNRDDREGNWRLGMGRQRRLEKGNKSTLGTERCENIKNLYINKKIENYLQGIIINLQFNLKENSMPKKKLKILNSFHKGMHMYN